MLRISYSIADLDFGKTSSVGIYNISLGLLGDLATNPSVSALSVFSNSSITGLPCAPGKINVVNCDQAIRSKLGRVLWDQFGVYRMAQRAGSDWLVLPKGYAPFMKSCPANLKLAVYMHDIIRLYYEWHYPGFNSRGGQVYFHAGLSAVLRNARVILTNTEYTKSEIQKWAKDVGIECPPIVVVGYGFGCRRTPGQKKDQILVFVRHTPHKLPGPTIEFMKRWEKETSYKGEILCVGTLPDDVEFPSRDNWRLLPRIRPEEFMGVMSESRAIVNFSVYEGFGMPPVEAVLVGTPSVFSDIPPMMEVMAGTGCPFTNGDYPSFVKAMEQAFSARSETVAAWADKLAGLHNWPRVGAKTVEGLVAGG
jgi:hypothetical protein